MWRTFLRKIFEKKTEIRLNTERRVNFSDLDRFVWPHKNRQRKNLFGSAHPLITKFGVHKATQLNFLLRCTLSNNFQKLEIKFRVLKLRFDFQYLIGERLGFAIAFNIALSDNSFERAIVYLCMLLRVRRSLSRQPNMTIRIFFFCFHVN